jgi:hypothetical protein
MAIVDIGVKNKKNKDDTVKPEKVKPGEADGLVPAEGIPGRTDGKPIPEKVIGEEVIAYSTSEAKTVTAGKEIDIPGCLLPFDIGIWDVEYSASVAASRSSGVSAVGGRLRITDDKDKPEQGTESVISISAPNGAAEVITQLYGKKRIIVKNNPKTFKLSFACSVSSNIGSVTVYKNDSNIINGISGNEACTYIRAVRAG